MIYWPHKKDSDELKQSVVVCDNEKVEEPLIIASQHGGRHIVQNASIYFDQETDSGNLLLKNPKQFLTHPFSVMLRPEVVSDEAEKELEKLKFVFSKKSQKYEILDSIQTYLKDNSFYRNARENVKLAADELFMNVLYEAPYDKSHKPIDRKEEISLQAGKTCQMRLGCFENRIALLCEDPFGSLDVNDFLAKINNCFKIGVAATINRGPGGAGIGAFLMYKSCSSLYVSIEKGKRTLMGCVFYSGRGSLSYKEEDLKNLHLINF